MFDRNITIYQFWTKPLLPSRVIVHKDSEAYLVPKALYQEDTFWQIQFSSYQFQAFEMQELNNVFSQNKQFHMDYDIEHI